MNRPKCEIFVVATAVDAAPVVLKQLLVCIGVCMN